MQSSTTDIANSQEQDQALRAQVELLRTPINEAPASNSAEEVGRETHPSPSPDPSNGYDSAIATSRDAAPAFNSHQQDTESYIHPDLRPGPLPAHAAQLAAAMSQLPPPQHKPRGVDPRIFGIRLPPRNARNQRATPGDQPPADGLPPGDGEDGSHDGEDGRSKPKRELSQSKRAAQNRAAQRAFRQRKETYIRQLEQENKTFHELEKTHKEISKEAFYLREYVLTLQTRLLEVDGRFPTPPQGLVLYQQPAHPSTLRRDDEQQQQPQQQQSPHHEEMQATTTDSTPLEYVARAVANIAAQEYGHDQEMKDDQHTPDTRTADEINEHLNVDGAEASRSSEV